MPLTGDAKRVYQRKWIAERRQAWIDENGPCQLCGSDLNLEVDHVNRKAKLIKPSSLWGMSATNPKRIAELAKCQVLCEDCHNDKSSFESYVDNTRPIRHGTQYAYNTKGCRCEPCMSWRALHYAETKT